MQRAIVKFKWPPYTRRDRADQLEAKVQVCEELIRIRVVEQLQEENEQGDVDGYAAVRLAHYQG